MAIFGFDLENEISVCVRNGSLETGNWKPGLTEKIVQNLGLTAEPCRKPKIENSNYWEIS